MTVASRDLFRNKGVERHQVLRALAFDRKLETGRHDANDGPQASGEIYLASDDIWIAVKQRFPGAIRKHDHPRVDIIFFAGVGASEHWLNTEDAKDIRGNGQTLELPRFLRAGKNRACPRVRGQTVQGLGLGAKIDVFGKRIRLFFAASV